MKLKSTLFCILIFSISSILPGQDFVYLFSGQTINAKRVVYKTPFLGANTIIVDSIKYDPDRVKFYQNVEGFYANIQYTGNFFRPAFAHCTEKGKINLFEYSTTTYSAGVGMYGAPGMGMGGGVSMGGGSFGASTSLYYNKGFGDLKQAHYKNLMVDLADNPQSMLHLQKIKDARTAQIVLGVIGSALMLGGFAAIVSKSADYNENDPNATPDDGAAIGVCVAGAACFGVVWIISFSKDNQLHLAIDAYNK